MLRAVAADVMTILNVG